MIDLTNQRFGKLVALYPIEERTKQGSVQWFCQCDCGNTTIVSSDNLRREHTKSCGCSHFEANNKRLKDLTGQVFGKWTVLYHIEHTRPTMYMCRCECGTEKPVRASHLKDGSSTSCGCRKSKGEDLIAKLLNELNIKFEAQKRFDTCFRFENKRLPFDFYLPEYNLCIEYDGEQHSRISPTHPYCTEEAVKATQERDAFKTQWCIDNNINLLRIDYTEYNNINKDYLLKKIKEFNND